MRKSAVGFREDGTILGRLSDKAFAVAVALMVVTAAFNVAKSSAVIDDFVSTSNYKAIPGARMEYTVTLTNIGSAAADTVIISDPLPPQTAFFPLGYNSGASDVRVTVGSTDTFCVAELGGDTNLDGCSRTVLSGVTTLTVRNPVIPAVAPADAVTVRFRVTIQ